MESELDPTLLYQWIEDVSIDPINWWQHCSGLVSHTHGLFSDITLFLALALFLSSRSVALPSLLTFRVFPHEPIRRYTACLASQWEDMIYVWTINQSTKELTHLTCLQTF
jgi:hypothetical protein